MRRQSSIGQEFLWLLVFFAIFGVVAALALTYGASHHFNDRIAIVLAALGAGLVTIALRGFYFGPRARRP